MTISSTTSTRPAATTPAAGEASTSSAAPRDAGPSAAMPATGGLSRREAVADGTGPRRTGVVIGVMGGMGPAASNQFGHQLIDLKTGAKADQQHARVLLDQATDIPDRTGAILSGGPSPVKNMEQSLKRLDAGGADLVAVTCNTAHHFIDDMQRAIDKFGLKLEMLHIVDATMKELEAQKPGAKRVGLLATSGTLKSKIYENRAEQIGQAREWVYPNHKTQLNAVMAGIYDGVKAGDDKLGKALLLSAAEELKAKGVDAILLACTEIPLVLKTSDELKGADGKPLPLIDTLGSLAKEALARADNMPGRIVTDSGSFSVQPAEPSGFVQAMAKFFVGKPERPRRIGVMGGMGPAAAIQFSDYMVKFNTEAKTDQQHVPMMVDQATDIPDRTAAILSRNKPPAERSPSPVDEMAASLRRLAKAGADEIVMTCNTAHFFFPEIQKVIEQEKLKVNVVHIVEATMKLLDQQAPGASSIGLLATSGTVSTGVYQNHASATGRTWLTPTEQTQQEQVMKGIYDGVKTGDMTKGRELLKAAAQELANQGADAILLACTEIPLVLKTGAIKNKAGKVIPLIDTLEAQAREAIARAKVPVPATPSVLKQIAEQLCLPADGSADHAPALSPTLAGA